MVHVEYDTKRNTADIEIEGSFNQICAELGLVILRLSQSTDLGQSPDDILNEIKEAIDFNIEDS